MNRVIHFTKVRIPAIALSLLVIIGGFVGTFMHEGFNLGIDFRSGISMRVQIAESVLKVSYSGNERAVINIANGVLQLTMLSNGGLNRNDHSFTLADYASISDLSSALKAINGVSVEETGNSQLVPLSIIGLNYATDLTTDGIVLNCANTNQDKYIDIADIRNTLSELGSPKIQTVGKGASQEFIIGMQNNGDDKDFNVKASSEITRVLGQKYGAANVVVKQTDYVGPQFSQSLGGQAVKLTCLALVLILVYIWFRFKLAYAVAAVTALVHDVLVMVGVIGAFQFEVNTATIAAVLTIVGYSLNDTIVIFDRIRENQILLRDKDFVKVVNISITQSLSRTLITSLTTLLAVVAIYIFGSGMIKMFALNLIIGIVVGTYSSIFIASPVLIWWINAAKKVKSGEAEKKSDEKTAVKEEAQSQLASDTANTEENKEVKPLPSQNIRRQPKRKGRR